MSFGPDVSVGGAAPGAFGPVTVASPTQLTAQIAVSAAAALGPRTPVAQTGKELASLDDGFNILGTVTGAPPSASISSPAEGADITERTPVAGTIASPNLAYWTLEYKLADATTWTQFATGTTPAVSGTFDPTMLLNGTAQIRLTALDSSGQATRTIANVMVGGNQKVGVSILPAADLSVPTPGIPLQVLRVYDNRDTRSADFGAGWTLASKNVRLTVNGPIGEGWQGTQDCFFLTCQYCIEATRPHRVAATLASGQQYLFDVTLTNACAVNQQPTNVIVNFTPAGPTPASSWLQMAGFSTGTLNAQYPGPVTMLDPDSSGTLAPDQYGLLPPDGRQFLISRQNGLQSVTDLNGNTVTYTPDGIQHSNGQSVVFSRDDQGRITAATDPADNQATYAYSAAGDLTGATNQAGQTTTYAYSNTHALTGTTDPLNVQVDQDQYYPDGRLASHTDALGHTTYYADDLDLRQEMITDRLGRVTVNEYDSAGNIVRTTDAAGGLTTRTFDANNNMLTQTDPLGRTRTYTYDTNNNRTGQTDPLGNRTSYTYDSTGRLLTVTDPLGRVTVTNVYEGNGNLTTTTDALGNTTTYTYDAQGQQTSVTDPLGNKTSYQYDANGNKIQETDPLGHTTSYTYDANNNVLTKSTTRTTSSGMETLTTTWQYDSSNRIIKTIYADSSTETTAYNVLGQVATSTDRLGRQTTYLYDNAGQLTTTTFPDGSTETSTYDAEGNLLTSTDRLGRATSYAYDGVNRLIQTIYPDGAADTTTFDLAGQRIATTDPLGNTTQFSYDAAGRRTAMTDALGHVTSFTYDAAGNRVTFTDARGNTNQYQHDALNRVTMVTCPDATYTQVARDTVGRISNRTDQALLTTQYSYDPAGRLLQTTDALGQITRQAYDELGERVSQTDANGHVTTYAYDKMGRRTKRTLPLGMAETWTYDAAGNISSHADFRGKTTTYTYDLLNRLLTKVPDPSLGEPTVAFTYTAAGERASMVDAAGTTRYTYDQRSQLLTKAAPQGTLAYTWDAAGNLLSIRSSNANGTSVNYAYDSLNRLSTVTDNRLAAGLTQHSYDAVGNLAGVLYPNGVESTYGYDGQNRLTGLAAVKGTTAVGYYAYSLGPAGNRLSLTEASGRQVSYSYDALYRLTGETIAADPNGANGTTAYTYDPVGNRLSRNSTLASVPSTTSAFDANDRLQANTYDANGNTINAGGNTYVYDFENHLKQANSGAVSIVYDGNGNRVAATAGGVTTTFLVDTVNPTGYPQVLEEVGSSGVQRVYTYGVTRVSQSQLVNGAWASIFYGYDGQNSVRYLTDSTGAVTDRYAYDAFGNQLVSVGSTPNVYRYTAEPYDAALQLTYLRARYLDPSSGRFWTMDSLEGNASDPPSLHKYLYAYGDPVDHADPSGQFPWLLAGIGALVVLLIWASIDVAYALPAGDKAQEGAKPMVQAALANLQSGQPIMQMTNFLRYFMGWDYYLHVKNGRLLDPDDAKKQLAKVGANYRQLATGLNHWIFYFTLPSFEGAIASSMRNGPPAIILHLGWWYSPPAERSRAIIHELCHIVLGFDDGPDNNQYGDAPDVIPPKLAAQNPDLYSFYALHSLNNDWPGVH
jgi:RHS repeat-associated protein